jgi:hypothetical protein
MEVEMARCLYKTAVQPLTRPPKSWEVWLAQWEKAMDIAQHAKVPEATDFASWWMDHCDALRKLQKNIPTFTFWIHFRGADYKRQTPSPTYQQVARDFEEQVIKALQDDDNDDEPRSRRATRGAFGPTFEASSSNSGKQKSSKTKRKHQSETDNTIKCPGCMMRGHNLDKCFYAFPDLAYKGWTGRSRWKTAWEKNSKKLEVQRMLKQIKGKKQKS